MSVLRPAAWRRCCTAQLNKAKNHYKLIINGCWRRSRSWREEKRREEAALNLTHYQNNHTRKIACSELLGCSNLESLAEISGRTTTVNKIIFTPLLSPAHVTIHPRPVALFSRPLAQESHRMLAVSPPSQNVQIRDSWLSLAHRRFIARPDLRTCAPGY